jgi:Rrf2 family protein
MKISRTAVYALHATLQLAKSASDGPVPCSRLAADGKMPERFLVRVLRDLVAHGILESARGIDGGYTLARTPAEITLLQLIEAVDGPPRTLLPPGDGLPKGVRIRLENALDRVSRATRRELAAIRLSHLLPGSQH